LFFVKWSAKIDQRIDTFLSHFKSEWIVSTNYSYEGAAVGVPSTENGLESVNGIIKKLHILGELLSVSTFLRNAMKMMSNWSKD
jgi:hypothetical protein